MMVTAVISPRAVRGNWWGLEMPHTWTRDEGVPHHGLPIRGETVRAELTRRLHV